MLLNLDERVEPVYAGSGERGFVHEHRNRNLWREADQGFASGRQEEMRGAADASAEHDDVGREGSGVLIESESEMATKVEESLTSAAMSCVAVVGIDLRGK